MKALANKNIFMKRTRNYIGSIFFVVLLTQAAYRYFVEFPVDFFLHFTPSPRKNLPRIIFVSIENFTSCSALFAVCKFPDQITM